MHRLGILQVHPARQAHRNSVGHAHPVRQRRLGRVFDELVEVGHVLPDRREPHELGTRPHAHRASDGSVHHITRHVGAVILGSFGPCAGRGERLVGLGRVERGDECRPELEEGSEDGMHPVVQRPLDPSLGIHLDLDVREAVGQRRRHPVGHTPVGLAVTCGNHPHVGLQHVLTHAPVVDELVGNSRHAGRRRVDLVEEQHDHAIVREGMVADEGQGARCVPDGEAVLRYGDAAQVHAVVLRQANVHQFRVVGHGQLLHRFRFTCAGLTPEHHRFLLVDRDSLKQRLNFGNVELVHGLRPFD